jgi:hypothetical protein
MMALKFRAIIDQGLNFLLLKKALKGLKALNSHYLFFVLFEPVLVLKMNSTTHTRYPICLPTPGPASFFFSFFDRVQRNNATTTRIHTDFQFRIPVCPTTPPADQHRTSFDTVAKRGGWPSTGAMRRSMRTLLQGMTWSADGGVRCCGGCDRAARVLTEASTWPAPCDAAPQELQSCLVKYTRKLVRPTLLSLLSLAAAITLPPLAFPSSCVNQDSYAHFLAHAYTSFFKGQSHNLSLSNGFCKTRAAAAARCRRVRHAFAVPHYDLVAI